MDDGKGEEKMVGAAGLRTIEEAQSGCLELRSRGVLRAVGGTGSEERPSGQ